MVKRVIIIFTALLVCGACSVKKNTWRSRAWHNVNSEFNVKFNGGESFKQGIKKAEGHQVADYAELLPVFIFADEGVPGQVTGDMERAIDKSNKLVTKHSITAKPKKKKGAMSRKEREFYNRREFNAVVDDAYLLSAKASLYLQNYTQTAAALDFLLLEYPKASAASEAKIWLAVALTYSDDVDRVPTLLAEVSREKKLSRYKRSILHAAYANYYIRRQLYAEAAADLEKALKAERRKANKIRYRFVLANLYGRLNEPAKATLHLEKIIKLSREYEQVFSARLMLASAYDPSSKRNMRKALLQMLDDDKNKDYADRIYYALAQAERAAGDDSAAVSYLKKSIDAEESHPRQRGYAYEMLGNYCYDGKDYAGAYDNLLSAAESLGASYSRYQEIHDKALSLEKVAKNWKIVHRQDSLQRIAKMPAAERDKFIDGIISKIVEEERKAAEEQRYQQLFINQQEQARYSNTLLSKNTSGQWYFYNVNSINTGRGAFNMRWGKRRLEDNWRRKDRSDMSAIGTDDEEEGGGEEETKKTELSNKSREYYLRDLPLTPEAMEASNNKLRPALFNLGEAYMNDMHELQMSVNTFEDLNKRFNKHEFLASTYYYLCKLYNELGNLEQSEHHKRLLIAEYPQEPLAQMLANPNYLKEQRVLHDNIESLYAEAFTLYRNGRYAEASQAAAQINERYPQNLIQSQIALLHAFTMAQTESIGVYKRALSDIVKLYPTSEAAQTATNLLSVLDESVLKYNAALQQPEQPAVAVAEDTSSVKYVLNLDGEHYFAFLFNSKQNSNALFFATETYNADYFLNENYETDIRELPKGYAMLLVKTFADGQAAAQYAQRLGESEIMQPFNTTDFRRLLITSENLELLVKTGEIVDYLDFFNMYYAHLFPKN